MLAHSRCPVSAATHPQPVCTVVSAGVWGWHQDVVISESVVGEACTCALAKVFKPKGPARNSQPSRLRRPIRPLPSFLLPAGRDKGNHHPAGHVLRTLSKEVKCRKGAQLRSQILHTEFLESHFSDKLRREPLPWSGSSIVGYWCFPTLPWSARPGQQAAWWPSA